MSILKRLPQGISMFLQSKILWEVDQHMHQGMKKINQATIGEIIDVDCWEAGKKSKNYLHFKVEQVEENETS